VGDAGRVLAVEPSPAVIGEAKWHFQENGRKNIELIEVALADPPGKAFFEETQLSTTGRLAATPFGNIAPSHSLFDFSSTPS
jgi:FkbM family methyltransferase